MSRPTRTELFDVRNVPRVVPSRAQDVVNYVHSLLRFEPRTKYLVDTPAPIITDDDIACQRLEFSLSSHLMCGVRVRLDTPIVEFTCNPYGHKWSYADFLVSGNEFFTTLCLYLDSFPDPDAFEREIEAARINPEIVKMERVWRAYLSRTGQIPKYRSVLKNALERICTDPTHDGERRPFHQDILSILSE